jgi:hypothetical protein
MTTSLRSTTVALLLAAAAPLPSLAAPELLNGQKLVLKDSRDRAERAFTILSRDPAVTLGRGNGSQDDPVEQGGSLRLVSFRGGTFDTTYPLAKDGWTYVGAKGQGRGYKFKGAGSITSVRIKPGGPIKVTASGEGLGHSLNLDPRPVHAVLTLGEQAYCLAFAGAAKFTAGRKLLVKNAAAPTRCGPVHEAPWPMHPIDSRFRGANALSPADVDRDGYVDYVTNYEFDSRYVIEFHPGAGGNPRRPWPSVVAFRRPPLIEQPGADTEHAALADFDGDGNLDIVGAQGWHFTWQLEGQEAGVRLIFGPPQADLLDPSAWTDAGRFPSTIDQGHFLWVVPFDVNGDGAIDIMTGGRLHNDNGNKAAVRWLEAPLAGNRRDLSGWQMHFIDPEQLDGHGFVLTDVDADGDQDLLDANADFDTPEDEETVHWYENPGTGSPAQANPWPKHVLYQGPEFDAKPQIAVADLDRDGLEDFVTAVPNSLYYFRKTSVSPATFERIVVPKVPPTQQFTRPLRIGDIDGDGRLDVFGMLVHEDGDLPADHYAAFWMAYDGTAPRADNWTTHMVKWGSGKTMAIPFYGEKWDQLDLTDVDRDGDLDAVANCEEWWEEDDGEITFFYRTDLLDPDAVSVVWFENRLNEEPYVCDATSGQGVIEAEHYTDLGDSTWVIRATNPGHAGDSYIAAHNALATSGLEASATKGIGYAFDVAGGTYTVWVRRWVPSDWGYGMGGALSNAVWLAVDAGPPSVADDQDVGVDGWSWVRLGGPFELAPGTHVLNLRVRERGYAIDRVLLTSDPAFTPSGIGPAETLRLPSRHAPK